MTTFYILLLSLFGSISHGMEGAFQNNKIFCFVLMAVILLEVVFYHQSGVQESNQKIVQEINFCFVGGVGAIGRVSA